MGQGRPDAFRRPIPIAFAGGMRFDFFMAYLNSRPRTPKVCPVCGEDVPAGALACPECGADHQSGWRPGALDDDGLDLPGEEFDYDAFVKEEFGGKQKSAGIRPLWWITAIILLAAMVLWLIAGGLL